MAESTLLFQHSQRESSAPILALSIDKSTGNFVTHDESATRLWSLKKMIKSTRIEKKEEQKFLELLCMDQLERLLLIFTLKASCDGKGGVIHVLSLSLAKIQTIDLNYHSIIRFSICPSQSEVLIVDKHRTVQSVHIEFLLTKGQNAMAQNTNKPTTAVNMYNPLKHKAAPCLKLHEVQSMDHAKAVIMDALMVNDNTFALLSEKSVKLYSRPQLLYVPPIIPVSSASVTGSAAGPKAGKKKWISKKERAAMVAAGIDPDAGEKSGEGSSASVSVVSVPSVTSTETVQKYSSFTLTGKLSIQCNIQGFVSGKRIPTLLKLASKDKLLVGFDNGSLQILYCPSLVDPANVKKAPAALQIKLADHHSKHSDADEEKSKTAQDAATGTMAAVLCDFQAHLVPNQGGTTEPRGAVEEKSGELLHGGSSTLESSVVADDVSEYSAENNAPGGGNGTKRSPLGLKAAFVCPWGACSGGPGLGYQFELLTLGSDHRIAHWGVRFKDGKADVVLVPHFANTTRVSTAVGNEQMNDDEVLDEGVAEFDDSLASSSLVRPKSRISLSDLPMESDLLGEYQLPQDLIDTTNTSMLALAFELSLVRNPVCKKVVCVLGGMMMFFDALQPHRIVAGRKTDLEKSALGIDLGTSTMVARATKNEVSALDMHNLIIASAKGPELSQVANRIGTGQHQPPMDTSSDSRHTQSTVLLLRAQSVEVVLVQTGQVLQYLSTANLHEAVMAASATASAMLESTSPSKKGMGRQGHLTLSTQLMRQASFNGKEVRAAEGKPSTVYWCALTHLVLVGYTTGGVGLLGLSGAIHSAFSEVPVVHLQSSTQHGTDITKIITFNHRLQYKSMAPTGAAPPLDVVIALISDANGVISLWQIYPASKKPSAMLFSIQGHSGRIVYAHSCLLEENTNHRIIVTACSQGMMKAWKLENNGSLTLTAFFHVELNGARLTSALAIPSIYYEFAEAEDMSSAKSTASSVGSGAAGGNVVSSVHREIYCVIGLSNGIVESWMISDHKDRSQSRPIARLQDSLSPVTQLLRHPAKTSLRTSLKNHSETLFTTLENNTPVVCLCEDGTSLVMKLQSSGQFKRSSYFMMPAPVNNAICLFTLPAANPPLLSAPAPVNAKDGPDKKTAGHTAAPPVAPDASSGAGPTELNFASQIECVFIGDFKMHHALPVTSSHVPSLWHRNFDDSVLVSHQVEHGPLGASKYLSQTLSLLNTSPQRKARSPATSRRATSPSATKLLPNFPTGVESSLLGSSIVSGPADLNRKSSTDQAVAPKANITATVNYEHHNIDGGDYYVGEDTESREAIDMQRLAERGIETVPQDQNESMSTIHASQSVTDDRRHYVGPMESMQRIVSSELHFAKKDSRLLELFAQHEPDADGTVSLEVAAEIVFVWLNSDKIAKQNIWELFRLLEIQDSDRLRFVEVAKIAAVVTSAMNKSAASKSSGRNIAYKQMKAYTTKVTYNSMGEKSVEKVLLPKVVQEGIFKGFASVIRAVWKKQPPRVVTQAETLSQTIKPQPAILHELPKVYDKLLPKGIPLPKTWGPDNTHWFHPLRVIRIARTLLDIRSSKQHEVFMSASLFKSNSADVTTLQEILVKYFERNYGETGQLLDVSRHKIAHFLEACCQYKHHPIVNLLQCMLRLEPAFESTPQLTLDTAQWMCVEARSMLCSRGCVVSGELIQPYADDEFGATKDGSVLQARWQYVPKADVLLCADEMLRERGKYGPSMFEQMLKIIGDIPSVESFMSADGLIHKTDTTSPMIDLERFLEVLYHEFIHFDQHIREAEVSVFGEHSMSVAVTAQSRDIVKGKRRLVMDDHISPFGPHHEANLSKIRSWLLEFEQFDPMRTGVVSQDVFKNSVMHRAEMIDFLGASNTRAEICQFIKFCCGRFVQSDPDGKISYLDMFALLCAWEWQMQGSEEFLLKELNHRLPGMHRTVEQSFAENLVKYFRCMSFIPGADPIWTMGEAPEGAANPYATKSSAKPSMSITKDGFWNSQTNAPQDKPGLLTLQREPIHNAGQVNVLPVQSALKHERTKLSTEAIPTAPQVLHTGRVQTTMFGETIQPVRSLPVAPLTMHTMDASMLRPLDQPARDREVAMSRASYSRSVENISTLTFTASMSHLGDGASEVDSLFLHHESAGNLLQAPRPKTPDEIRSTMDDQARSLTFPEIDEMASQFMSLDAQSSQLKSNFEGSLKEDSLTATMATYDSNYGPYPGALLGSFAGSNFESLDPTLVRKSLAEEEVLRLRRAQMERERELLILQRAEKEEMEKRRQEKVAMREQIRREMKRKEREGMAYYHAAIDIKYKHNEEVRQKMDAINAALEEDKHQKEREILRIQQENMARSLQKVADKDSQAEAEAQLKRQNKELKMMRKEDEAMKKMTKALALQDRKAKEAQKKLEKEAADREAAALVAQFTSTQPTLTEDTQPATTTTDTSEPEATDTADEGEVDHDAEADADVDHEEPDPDEEEEPDDADGDDEGEHEGEEQEEMPTETEPVVVTNTAPAEPEDMSEEEIEAARNLQFELQEKEAESQRSAGQMKMKYFLDMVKKSTERHASHPRKQGKKFFMPMMFAEDIFFDPFETDGHDQKGDEAATMEDGDSVQVLEPGAAPSPAKDPFDDVNSRMAAFRKEEERKRKALFSTTLQEIPSKDWIRVFRTYTVDWDAFFASQDAMVELTAAVKESEREYELHFRNNDPLKRITDTLSVGPNSPALSRAGSHLTLGSSVSLSGTLDESTAVVTTLPYGKILEHQKVQQGDYKYYKIEQHKQTALLTVEIQCSFGLVDLYLAFQKLPSMSMHDRHVACTKENKGLVRLAFRPHKSGTFFIAVRSHETDAKFNIWTYSSSGNSDQSPIIARVNTIIRKFELLAAVDENELQEFYPKYEKQALQTIKEEEEAKRLQDEASLHAPPREEAFEPDDDASIDELYDIESVGRFIAKVSKYTLMGGEESSQVYGEQGLQTGFDDDELDAQEFGQELSDRFMPMQSEIAADLLDQADAGADPGAQNGGFLPPIGRAQSLPSLEHVRSEITMDSFGFEDEQNSFKLPGIKGATPAGTAATPSSYSTKRTVSKSKSAISVAREYAALDRALHSALRGKEHKKKSVENPMLHQYPKPIKYQLTGKNNL